MFDLFQVITVSLVGLAVVPALAHALELPGKMRLTRDTYFAVQRIYYPGFTIAGGVGEAGGLIATLVLFLLTPPASAAFWPTAVALLALAGMEVVYWTVTHPVNKVWLRGQTLGSFGSGFFSFASRRGEENRTVEWTDLRDRWEYSHVVRAVLAVVSLIGLVIAA
jgi:preprotein translocase subunit SecE